MKDVIISNKKEFQKKLDVFKKSGSKKLHVVSDFDQTLTMAFFEDKKRHSTFALIREGNYLGDHYVKKAFGLHDIYRPIEINPNIPIKEKSAKMVEWWIKHLELMRECGMSEKVIKEIIKKGEMKLRNGASELLNLLAKNKIPLLIFSAGLGDMIKEHLEHEKIMHKNIHIIANFYKFDEDGKIAGYKSYIVHSFNKNKVEIKKTLYYKEIKKRKNVLLLGDTLSDIGMSEGLEHDNIIKVCFLNKETNHLLEDYKKHFDVIILNDGSVEFVNKILKEIIKH